MNIIKSDAIQLQGAVNSMQGGRPENQDDFAILDTPLGFLAVVCDGMGGGPGGKTASYIAKYEIANALCECTSQTPRDHALKMAASRANDALEKKMCEVPSLQGMGSTFVAVLINKDSAFIAHAGDSRCYLLRGNKCVYRSQDHSLVGELVRKKALTEEEARLSPQSNVISRGLGSTSNHVPEIEEIPYKKGDRIVLCTDGVWGIMPHTELLKRFTQKNSSQQIVSNISSEVDNIGFSKGGHHDNHTIAILDLGSNSIFKAKMSLRKIAIICSTICVLITVIVVVLILSLKNDGNSNTPTKSFVGATSGSAYQSNTDVSLSSTSSTTDTSKVDKNTEDNSSPQKVGLSNTDTIMKQLNSVLHPKDDDISNQKKDSSSEKNNNPEANKPAETTQKVINRYNSAKAVEGATTEDAQKKLEDLRKEVKTLMSELHKQCESNSNVTSTVEAIERLVDDKRSWFVNREKDKTTGKFKPTQNAQDLMDKQIKRLTELKTKFK